MSSLRLALKQSLQETGHLFKEKKKKSSGKNTKADARRRRPGDPPRKRGRPRKVPAPDDAEPARADNGELKASDGNDATESENEFSYDSEEEEDDSEEGEDHEEEEEEEEDDDDDDNRKENHHKVDDHPGQARDELNMASSTVHSASALPSAKSETDNNLQDDMDHDDERKRQKKLFKKNLQQAANKIQAQWKKKTGISRGSTDSSFEETNGTEEIEGRSHSPMRSRDVSSSNSTPTNGNDKKKKKDGPTKTQTVPPPEPEVLEWSRSLSEKKSRKHITSGLRVKVRFAAKVKRDGKVVKKKIWYGGRVSAVSKEGSKIRIKYDDGTSEIAKFPDKDVVVDDKFNGKHLVPADKFVPPVRKEDVSHNQGDHDPSHDVEDAEVEQEYQEKSESSKVPESISAQNSEEHCFAQVVDASTQKLPSLNIEQASSVNPEIVKDEEEQNKNVVASLESPPITMELQSNQPSDGTAACIPSQNHSHAVVTPKPNAGDADIASVREKQLSHALGSQQVEELSSPGLSVMLAKPLSPESKRIDEDRTEKEPGEIAATLEASTIQTPKEGQWSNSDKKQSDSEPAKISVMVPTTTEEVAANLSDPVAVNESQAKTSSPNNASPSSSKRTLTIRISNKIDAPAPNTPKIDSDSEEELLADTPITERKVKSIQLKGKSKRKRETDSAGEENPSKKRISLKRDKAEESTNNLLLPPADESTSTSRTVDVLGAIEALSALAGAGAEPKDTETKKPHITINLRKTEAEQEDHLSIPKLKKVKERSGSPTIKGRISPIPRPRSRSPTPVTEVTHTVESEADGAKSSNQIDVSNAVETSTRSPKPTKVVARIKGTKNDTPEASAMDENMEDVDDSNLSLVRSRDSAESLPNMRTGRRAAQQAKEKMNPKQEEKALELGKKKKKRKRLEGEDGGDVSDTSVDDRQWVQCDSCGKWRILPSNVKISSLPKHWYCHLNTYDPKRNNCNAPEQTAKQAAKEWRKQRKRAKQQRLVELQALDAPKVPEEQPVDTATLAVSPKPPKGAKKEKLEPKRNSPIASEEAVDTNGLSDVSKLEKKPKKGKQTQPPEEVPEVPPIPVPAEAEGKKPGRKRGRPARNTPNKESEDSENVEWVQCEKCEKWRKLPPHISADELPDTWYCTMNTWNPDSASCGAPEDKADATHHEVGNYAGIFGAGAGKYSYRTMIFGNGKKHNRPMSERSRAAESLFMRPIDEIENPYPTVMYSKSSCFLPRTSNFTKASVIEEETTPSIFDVLSNSQLWAELRTIGQPVQVSSGKVRPLSDRLLTYDSIPDNVKQAMREIVLRSLGDKTLTGDELILEIQRHPWENFAPDVASIRGYFNGDIIVNSLLGLVRDGVVEMTSMRNFKVPIGEWVPKYRKVRSLRAMKIEESIKSSRCMKIAKPWKQRECNSDWITGGSAFS